MASIFNDSTFNGALSTDDTLLLGTCALGSAYGQVKSASLKRGATVKEIPNCKGGIRAVLLMNPKTTLSMKAIFEIAGTLPQVGQPITLPLIDVYGIVTDVTVDWEEEGERQVTLEATGWDAVAASVVSEWDGSSYSTVWD